MKVHFGSRGCSISEASRMGSIFIYPVRETDVTIPVISITTLRDQVANCHIHSEMDLHRDTRVFTGVPVAPFGSSPLIELVLLTAAISR